MSNIVECFTYQLSLISSKHDASHYDSKPTPNHKLYSPGPIYSFDWIIESIKSGHTALPAPEHYLLMTIPYP